MTRARIRSVLGDGERHLPLNVDDAIETIQAIVPWIGEDWLKSTQGHPLRRLWRRRDVLATFELTILGRSLQRLQSTQHPSRLTDLAKAMKGNDHGNQIGAAYELTTAGMLTVPNQRVLLMGAKHPAYDVELEAKGRTIRFSCKALLQAEVERAFDAFVAACKAEVRACAAIGPVGCFCSLWDVGAGPEHLTARPPIRELHQRWLMDNGLEFKVGAWWVAFHKLTSEYPELTLSSRHPSFSLLVAAELDGREERRIASKMDGRAESFVPPASFRRRASRTRSLCVCHHRSH